MAGYRHILEIEELKAKCDELGFRMGYSERGIYNKEYGDVVALFPKDRDALPIYSRDAQLFTGTIESLKTWLRGIEWARNYDSMVMGKLNDKKRERKEQDHRNENLVRKLRESN
jgi:hypothetical protein